MPRTQLIVSYRGGAYAGWQRQTNGLGVQQVLEEALERLLGEPTSVTAAGRTDAGVHARGQSLHFDHRSELPPRAFVEGGNRFLPEDIRILSAQPRPADFHARFDAINKEYRYLVSTAPVIDALESWRRVRVPPETDFARMNRAAAVLVGRHDFSAFALAGGSHRSPVRTLRRAEWLRDGDNACLVIVGDGFLRGMVRCVVGTLLEVGLAKRKVESVTDLIQGAPRFQAGPTAPAHGLVLEGVEYSAPTGENSSSEGG